MMRAGPEPWATAPAGRAPGRRSGRPARGTRSSRPEVDDSAWTTHRPSSRPGQRAARAAVDPGRRAVGQRHVGRRRRGRPRRPSRAALRAHHQIGSPGAGVVGVGPHQEVEAVEPGLEPGPRVHGSTGWCSGARNRAGSTASSITTGSRAAQAACSRSTTRRGVGQHGLVDHHPLGPAPAFGRGCPRADQHGAAQLGRSRCGHRPQATHGVRQRWLPSCAVTHHTTVEVDELLGDEGAAAMVELCERFGRYGMYSQEHVDSPTSATASPSATTRCVELPAHRRPHRQPHRRALRDPRRPARTTSARSTPTAARPRIAGIEPFLHHERFVDAARASVHGPAGGRAGDRVRQPHGAGPGARGAHRRARVPRLQPQGRCRSGCSW